MKNKTEPITKKLEGKSVKPAKGKTQAFRAENNKLKRTKKSSTGESTLSKKDFRENPAVEQLYRIIYKYKLRKEAYKAAIEIYLNLKK